MPRAARPDKADWKSTTRTRAVIRKRLMQLSLELGIPAEEINDYIVSVALGVVPFRNVVLPDRSRASGAA